MAFGIEPQGKGGTAIAGRCGLGDQLGGGLDRGFDGVLAIFVELLGDPFDGFAHGAGGRVGDMLGLGFGLTGVESGRLAYEAGRMPKRLYASASSPLDGTAIF